MKLLKLFVVCKQNSKIPNDKNSVVAKEIKILLLAGLISTQGDIRLQNGAQSHIAGIKNIASLKNSDKITGSSIILVRNHQFSGLIALSKPKFGNIWVAEMSTAASDVMVIVFIKARLPDSYQSLVCSIKKVIINRHRIVVAIIIEIAMLRLTPLFNEESISAPGTSMKVSKVA